MSFEFTGAFGLPSVQSALETSENVFWWGRFEQEAFIGSIIDGSARDAGNTGYTDVLRPGLLLGRITASGKLKEWNPIATDGTENLYGILGFSQKMSRMGANADRWIGWVYAWGFLKADRIYIPGSAAAGIAGNASEHLVRAQLGKRFTFSDQLEGNDFGGFRNVVAKTADYSVVAADHDTLFTNRAASGAVNFTLPAVALKGLSFSFYCVADQNLTVTGGTADTLITANDAAADSVAWSTSTEKIGGGFTVYGDGTSWLVVSQSPQTGHTVTVAT
tara:strand:+ start:2892 stop:3719 length:828 start_codon:yes stop_codon:yes gene_type:complete